MDRNLMRHLERIEQKLDSVLHNQQHLFHQGEHQMALGQDILAAVTAETTVIDSLIALINGWVANNMITAAEGQQILGDIAANKAKLEAAITANTPVAPTP